MSRTRVQTKLPPSLEWFGYSLFGANNSSNPAIDQTTSGPSLELVLHPRRATWPTRPGLLGPDSPHARVRS
jgi:hypothetical protein